MAALPEIPTRRDFVGRRARLGRGPHWPGPRLALRQPLHERPPQLPIPKPAKSTTPAPVTNPRPSPPGRTRASSSMTAQTGLGFALPRNFKKMLNTRDFVALAPNSLLDGTNKSLEQAVVSPKLTRQERSNTASRGHPEDAERAL